MKKNDDPLLKITENARNRITNLEVLHYFFNIKKEPFFSVKIKRKICSYDELCPESKILWDNKNFLLESFPEKNYVFVSEKKIEFIGDFNTANKLEYEYRKQTGYGMRIPISRLKNWKLKDK